MQAQSTGPTEAMTAWINADPFRHHYARVAAVVAGSPTDYARNLDFDELSDGSGERAPKWSHVVDYEELFRRFWPAAIDRRIIELDAFGVSTT